MPNGVYTTKDGCLHIPDNADIRIKGRVRKKKVKRGDRQYRETSRLFRYCPRCKMVKKTVQTVDEKKNSVAGPYAVIRYWCKTCEKVVDTEKMRLAGRSNGRT